MPKNVGKYQQGHHLAHPAKEPIADGVPTLQPLVPGPPPNEVVKPEGIKAAPNNDGHKV